MVRDFEFEDLKNGVVVFDLDDTLYKEVDFLRSAYREIATFVGKDGVFENMVEYWRQGANVFEEIIRHYDLPMSVDDLLLIYREHIPHIKLEEHTKNKLSKLSQTNILGIITDGRSVSQRNKVKALELDTFITEDNVLISEETGYSKPSKEPYLYFMEKYPNREYYYIGDNPVKDFAAPNSLGWNTICLLDDGRNIHRQNFEIEMDRLPQYRITTL